MCYRKVTEKAVYQTEVLNTTIHRNMSMKLDNNPKLADIHSIS